MDFFHSQELSLFSFFSVLTDEILTGVSVLLDVYVMEMNMFPDVAVMKNDLVNPIYLHGLPPVRGSSFQQGFYVFILICQFYTYVMYIVLILCFSRRFL